MTFFHVLAQEYRECGASRKNMVLEFFSYVEERTQIFESNLDRLIRSQF